MMIETNTGRDGANGRSWRRYAAVALVLVAVFLVLNAIESGESVRYSEADFGYMQAGDSNVKMYLFLGYLSRQGIPEPTDQTALLGQALESYKQAAESPSPAAIRRYGVLTYQIHRQGASRILDRLTSKSVLEDIPERDVQELRREARMWRDIYAGNISPDEAPEYEAIIKQVNLGPVRAFALHHFYNRIGDQKRAQQAILDAEARAASSLFPFGLLVILLIGAGLAGVVFIVMFLRNSRRWLAGPEIPPVETEDQTASTEIGVDVRNRPQVLFKGFIVYLLLTAVLGILTVLAFEPYLESLQRETRVVYLVTLSSVLTAVSGAVVLAYTYILLRRTGIGLDAMWLTGRDLGKNILWGAVGYCVALPLVLITSMLWSALLRTFLPGIETPVNPVVPYALAGGPVAFVIVFFMGVVIAPFFEEVFFRGMLYRAFRARLSVTAAVLLSGTAFGVVHPFPGGFLPILALGAVFALLVEIRRSLIPAMVAHALNNAVMFMMLYLLSIA